MGSMLMTYSQGVWSARVSSGSSGSSVTAIMNSTINHLTRGSYGYPCRELITDMGMIGIDLQKQIGIRSVFLLVKNKDEMLLAGLNTKVRMHTTCLLGSERQELGSMPGTVRQHSNVSMKMVGALAPCPCACCS